MIRRLLRWLIGPWGRRVGIIALVAAAWLRWAWTPLRPLATWSVSEYDSAMTEFAGDGSTALTVASSTRRVPPLGGIPPPVLDGPLRIWDLPDGRVRLTIPVAGPQRYAHLAADGSWLLTVSERRAVARRDPRTGSRRVEMPGPEQPEAKPTSRHALVISTDERLIATSEPDGRAVRVWEGLTGRLVAELTSARPPLAFSADGRRLLTAAADAAGEASATAALWDIASGRQLLSLPGHRDPVGCAAVSPDGRMLATGLRSYHPGAAAGPAEVRLWDAQTGQLLGSFEAGTPPSNIYSLEFSPDGRLLIVRGYGHGLVWDVTEMPPRNRDDLIGETKDTGINGPYLSSRHSPRYSADGRNSFLSHAGGEYLAVMTGSGEAWRLLSLPRHFGSPAQLRDPSEPRFSRDGRWLAVPVKADVTVYADGYQGIIDRHLRRQPSTRAVGTVQLYDAKTGRAGIRLSWYHGLYFVRAFSPDGTRLWTERFHRGTAYIRDGDTRIFEQWSVVDPDPPPAWLIAVTLGGFLLTVADWSRDRRRRTATA